MDVTQLPFNKFIGLQKTGGDANYQVSLPAGEKYTNHLGTVHASALFAAAEAGSGDFLLGKFGSAEGLAPVVRRAELKFKKPAKGSIYSSASVKDGDIERALSELEVKGRALITVFMKVVDEGGGVVLTAEFEWFIAKIK